jgi:putative FmdB family regulatory protein
MPTYQYACTECGEQLEVVQKFSDEPLTVCPACEGRLRKVFSPVGVVFKGSGFYKTDSRKSSTASSSTKSDAKSDAASDSKSDAKSDSGSGSGTKSDTTSDSSSATKQTKAASSSGGDGSKVA